jgi:hypothetical protein
LLLGQPGPQGGYFLFRGRKAEFIVSIAASGDYRGGCFLFKKRKAEFFILIAASGDHRR